MTHAEAGRLGGLKGHSSAKYTPEQIKAQKKWLAGKKKQSLALAKAKAKSDARKKASDELEAINKRSRDAIAARNKRNNI